MVIQRRDAVCRVYRRPVRPLACIATLLAVSNDGLEYRCWIGDASGFDDDFVKQRIRSAHSARGPRSGLPRDPHEWCSKRSHC